MSYGVEILHNGKWQRPTFVFEQEGEADICCAELAVVARVVPSDEHVTHVWDDDLSQALKIVDPEDAGPFPQPHEVGR